MLFFYSLLLLRGQTKNIKSWGGMRREIEGGMGYKGPQPNKIQKSFRQFRADALMNNRQPYCCLFFDSERQKLRTLKKKTSKDQDIKKGGYPNQRKFKDIENAATPLPGVLFGTLPGNQPRNALRC